MSPAPRLETSTFGYLFFMMLAITLLAYIARGFGLLAFIPGGIIWILILLSIGTGILYGVEKTKRF